MQLHLFFAVVFVLHAQLSQTNAQIQDYRLEFPQQYHPTRDGGLKPDVNCTKPGLACLDCNTVITCIDNGNGWDHEVVDTCEVEDGFTCLNGVCTDKYNPGCSGSKPFPFHCPAVGMFPDPFDCQSFHSCCSAYDDIDGKSFQVCDKGFAYDPVSTYCKTQIPDGCPAVPPVPICEKAGQSGALVNKSIFYICVLIEAPGNSHKKVLYPKLHLCANGKTYNGTKCV